MNWPAIAYPFWKLSATVGWTDEDHDAEDGEDLPDFGRLAEGVPPAAGRERPVGPPHRHKVGPPEDLCDRESADDREGGGGVEDEPGGRDRHEDRDEGPDHDDVVRGIMAARDLPQQVRDRHEAEPEREQAEGQDHLRHPGGLVLRDRRDDLWLDEVGRP